MLIDKRHFLHHCRRCHRSQVLALWE
jgi:hypothetical protein